MLLCATLRLFPDRIMIGEAHGAEALDLLKAWGTEHPGGFGTVHADDVPTALERMNELVCEGIAHRDAHL